MRAVLTYHSLDTSGSPVSVDPAVFEAQMDWLARDGPPVVSLAELVAVPREGDAVALTFDDGFENFATVAAPILRHRGLPATVFVVTGRVGRTNAWGGVDHPGIPRLPLMDWDTLGQMAEQGIELGGHTRVHPRLPRLSAARIEDEVSGCALDLEGRTGVRPTSFAYPYGALDHGVVSCVSDIFDRAVTTRMRSVRDGHPPHRVPRLDMFYLREPGRLEAWGTSAFRWRLMAVAAARELRALATT